MFGHWAKTCTGDVGRSDQRREYEKKGYIAREYNRDPNAYYAKGITGVFREVVNTRN